MTSKPAGVACGLSSLEPVALCGPRLSLQREKVAPPQKFRHTSRSTPPSHDRIPSPSPIEIMQFWQRAFGVVMRYDLLVLGDTPAAWRAAEDVALLGGSVAVLRPEQKAGDAAFGITAVLAAYDDAAPSTSSPRMIRPCDLWNEAVRQHERSIQQMVQTLDVTTWRGRVWLMNCHSACVFDGAVERTIAGNPVLIAVGTTARRPRGMTFDRCVFLLPEDVPHVTAAPRSLIVLGGNRTARAFARLFASAGSNVRIVDSGRSEMSSPPIARVAGDVVELCRETSGVRMRLADNRTFVADAILFAADRAGATACMNLAAAGLEADEDGRLWCDDNGQTWVPTVHAAGEVVGYPRHLRDDANAARRILAGQRRGYVAPLRVI